MSDPPLLRMPQHLLALILSQLDSTHSLASAILTHSYIHATFQDDRHRILRAVRVDQMPARTRPYANLALAASRLQPRDIRHIRLFWMGCALGFEFDCDGRPGRNMSRRLTWDSMDLRAVGENLDSMHAMVEWFTREFARDTLPLVGSELGLKRPQGTALSADETFRIHRAMYRFQMYCCLFQAPITGKESRFGRILRGQFFGRYSPWVNEQLACVHDYFERVLSRGMFPRRYPVLDLGRKCAEQLAIAFDEVAAHDIEWGHQRINWLANGERNPHKQGYVNRPPPSPSLSYPCH